MTKLEPPQGLPSDDLTVPQAPTPVQAEGSMNMIDPAPGVQEKLDQQVDAFLKTILEQDAHGDTFQQKVQAVHDLGSAEIRASAGVSNRLLERSVAAAKGGNDSAGSVTKSLLDLRKTVEDLDPARESNLGRRFLGIIPKGGKVRDYFLRYQSAQGHLNAILETLYRSRDELRKDNAAIEQEKANLWAIMQKLRGFAYIGQKLDERLSGRIDEIEARDPEKARVVREEMLFYVRQKVQDLLTQLAVSVQGYLALDLVRKNNLELIKGVDRATTTTVSALRTAVMVSQALASQKLVLDQIGALNTTTSNLIESTSALLKQQTADIHQQAAGSTVNLESLQRAFQNVYDTLDAVSRYKLEALGQLQQNVSVLGNMVEGAQKHLDRVRGETVREATRALERPEDFKVE